MLKLKLLKMEYNKFCAIFNSTIFEKSKVDLLTKIADNPHRYIGLFRPTKPKAKILQNLLQSHEIRFGDAFEKVIESYLSLNGCTLLEKKRQDNEGTRLDIDQCFEYRGEVYFIEQKVRDDHDSTKKIGQIKNFEKKLHLLATDYPNKKVTGIFYFIDDKSTKNRNYYTNELERMSIDYQLDTHIFYGKPLFEYLNMESVWEEILNYLEKWKKDIPDLPEINFDIDAENTFEEIKTLSPTIYRKLFLDEQIFQEIVLTLFPEKKTLKLLLGYFEQQSMPIYRTLYHALSSKV